MERGPGGFGRGSIRLEVRFGGVRRRERWGMYPMLYRFETTSEHQVGEENILQHNVGWPFQQDRVLLILLSIPVRQRCVPMQKWAVLRKVWNTRNQDCLSSIFPISIIKQAIYLTTVNQALSRRYIVQAVYPNYFPPSF